MSQASSSYSTAPDQSRRTELYLGASIIILVAIALFAGVGWVIHHKKEAQITQTEDRLRLIAANRVQSVSSWLLSLQEQTEQLISSDLFRIYATEVDMIDASPDVLITGILPEQGNSARLGKLQEQLPLMQQSFADFASFSGFLEGRIVHRSGQSYITSKTHLQPLQASQRKLIRLAFTTAEPQYAPLRQTPSGLTIDVAIPIMATTSETTKRKVAAIVLMTKAATENVNTLLANSPMSLPGERTRLMQQKDEAWQEVVPWSPEGIKTLLTPPELTESHILPFGKRFDLGQQKQVFSVALPVQNTPFWMVQEVQYADAMQRLSGFTRMSVFIVLLLLASLILLFGALWWKIAGQNHQRVASRFRALAQEMENQRDFLNSINDSIPDFVAVKDAAGEYVYANPALAHGVGRDAEDITGLDDVALFGFDTGKRLEASDEAALRSTKAISVEERIFLKSKEHFFQITKVALRESSNHPRGIVSIFRDITSMVHAAEQNRQTIQQTMEALVKTIEFADPFLAGHSMMMRELTQLVAEELHLDPEERATAEMASTLSQIGKTFIDKHLLAKTAPLSPEEKQAIQEHVQHTETILRQIPFDLPVVDAVLQMNENLDGSGYPQGLQGQAISTVGRILNITNSICAMLRPRSYRPAKNSTEILEILRQADTRYDQNIVDAVYAVLATPRGEAFLRKNGFQ